MYERGLQGKQKALGAEHTSTLDIINNLGSLYKNQGKLAEAELMSYQNAFSRKCRFSYFWTTLNNAPP